MTAAVIKATFSEWRMVKGRKVLQIVCEVPLEQQGDVFAALGAPMPDVETWVAIALLRPEAVASEPRKPTNLTQIAGILCHEPAFQRFAEQRGYGLSEAGAAEYIRYECGVKSRADINGNPDAARKFRDLKADYENWLREAA